jgi:hypothetical protein
VGAPFAILSATGPLLQHWFAPGLSGALPCRSERGSLGAFRLSSSRSSRGWIRRRPRRVRRRDRDRRRGRVRAAAADAQSIAESTARIRGDSARWVGLAFVPTMLSRIDQPHPPISRPCRLWVVPLMIHLASFVVASRARARAVVKPRAALACSWVLVFVTITHGTSWWLLMVMHCVSRRGELIAHRRLFRRRADATHLPEFYTWIALGGGSARRQRRDRARSCPISGVSGQIALRARRARSPVSCARIAR